MNIDDFFDSSRDRRVVRDHLDKRYRIGARVFRPVEAAYEPKFGEPTKRPLRIFASDPSLSRLEGRSVVLDVPYEPLERGPVGRLVEVDLTDRPSGDVYEPADLESRAALLDRGYAPSEADPRFHAQMVYAVVSTVHAHFRGALGRQIGWSFGADHAPSPAAPPRRLRLVPFAADEANAWYDAADGTLNFGYFAADLEPIGRTAPEARVFTSLANDIVAHETTHAMLDALRANFRVPSSNDMGGFHEGFADLVALFHRFLHRDVLRPAIVASHGDLRRAKTLTEIGQQFQSATSRGTALRSVVRDDPTFVYRDDLESHAMGELLATAVYDAFVTVYERKVRDDRRLASGGSGVFPAGALPDLLIDRLVERAERLAQQFLNMLIRAVDYLPPVDIRLGEYLRALITADADLVQDDPWGYREAFVDAFRRRGIYPRGVASLSEDALLWCGPEAELAPIVGLGFRDIAFASDPGLPVSVGEQIVQACVLGEYMTQSPQHMVAFGIVPPDHRDLEGDRVDLPIIESVRTLRRPGSGGRVVFDTVAEVLQLRRVAPRDGHAGFDLWGGSTLILNSEGAVRLLVRKSVIGEERIERRRKFLASGAGRHFWEIRSGKYVEKAGGSYRQLCLAGRQEGKESKMKYDLVFEGGGAKGMAFVGACDALYGAGHTHGRLLGTSAGAITAVLLAAGYTAEEMAQALGETNDRGEAVFTEFMGAPREFSRAELDQGALAGLFDKIEIDWVPEWIEKKLSGRLVAAMAQHERGRHVVALVERGGWYGADRFVSWFAEKLDVKSAGRADAPLSKMTLAQFHAATGTEVSVVAADTHDGSMLVLNHQTAPECPVVWAVRMSMSIPLLWDEVVWQAAWGKYRERDLAGHAIVDGGMLSNFPIELFLSDDASVTKIMGTKGSAPVLGFLLDETLPVPATTRAFGVHVKVKPGELATVQRLKRIVDTMMGAHDKRVMEANPGCIVRLPAKDYGTTEFAMTPQRRADLIAAAKAATLAHLSGGTRRSFTSSSAPPSAATAEATDRIARDLLAE